MAAQNKPTAINGVWAEAGDKTDPGASKVSQGWLAEIPTRQNMNWLQNLFGEFCKHINQEGVPVWDSVTEYFIDGIAKGSDGKLYRSLVDNNINNNPTSSPSEWGLLISVSTATESLEGIVELADATEAAAGTDATKAMTPLRVFGAFGTFGLGGVAPFSVSENIDTITRTRFSTTSASSPGTFPSGASKSGTLISVVRSSTYVNQYYHDDLTDRIHFRKITSGVPQPWVDFTPTKAWVLFDGTGTVSVTASKNVSSIIDRGVGQYTVNLATAMPSANYAVTSHAQRGSTGVTAVVMGDTSVARTASAVPIQVRAVDNTAQDASEVSIVITGD